MSIYAGLDVSDKTTHVCGVDNEGSVLRRDVVASDPDLLAKWLDRVALTWFAWCWKPARYRLSSIMAWRNEACRSSASVRAMPRACCQRG